ncbi:DUF3800 domain-containing protein [Methylocystis sp. 9N]|uniref:DUF3800 domain-containing protein n=1 Tax=Methylocystis borbori TaxID=3118750 RepID=A0ABU7XI50_9HYPH
MRYIYLDEAGTSAREPVTVVVGVITKPDDHWAAVRKEISDLVTTVPERYRQNFHFHAKSIWGDKKYREDWAIEDRLKLIAAFAAIPVKFGLSIALGKIRRDAGDQDIIDQVGLNGHFSLSQWHHARAFMQCALQADAYLRERCDKEEIATLIAEDVPDMRSKLRGMFEITKTLYVPPHLLEINGRYRQGISQIQDGVQFAEKSQAPILQVADACAFCFRRFFSEQSYGEELTRSMGVQLNLSEWSGPCSSAIFTKDPIKRISPYPLNFPGGEL